MSHTVDALHFQRDDFVHEPGGLKTQMLVSQSETQVTKVETQRAIWYDLL